MTKLDDSLLGKQLDEFRIDKPLGAGGMARVYRALDTKLRRYVALKVIAPDLRADSDHTQRFKREAQSIARLEHPNIVRIYRFGEVNGLYYMAMQYVEGTNVAWLIEDYRSHGEVMPIADIVRVVQDIGAALDYTHSKDVIHRDVKPGNIMLDQQGRALLTDFGLALLSDLGTRGEVFGSPHYISPEQAMSSGNVVPQSDLYALGVTMFEMLTDELPFSGGEPMDIAMRHVSEPPPRPSQFNKTIPASVDDVILRSLEKEPFDRYQTGAELSAEFQKAVADWPTNNVPGDAGVRRPSLVMVPQKISEMLAAAPLPSLPPLPPNRDWDVPTQPPPPAPSLVPTLAAGAAGSTNLAATHPSPRQRSVGWRAPLVFAAGIFVAGLIGLVLVILASHSNSAQTVGAMPTNTPIIPVTATTAVPPTPSPPSTELPEASPTPIELPTVAATFTPVALPALAMTVPPPTSLPVAIVPTQIVIPPENRSAAPPGSRRLGDFAVEGYCNGQGYGVKVVNNQTDWACTNKDGSIRFVLGPADFDNICRARYVDPAAFAIRDQQKSIQAYNWSCYDYPAQPAVQPTAIVIITSAAVATPSVTTLALRPEKDWVALVNISDTPLSLQSVEFRRDDQTIKATAWGQDILFPGECLRIYKADKAPKDAPPGCSNVIDYPGSKDERKQWFEGRVTVAINPSTTYCYPAAQCQ